MNKREEIFINNMKSDGKTYLFEHETFKFANGKKYTPDFYCVEDDKHIEVVGTRQAYHCNKDKYDRMKLEFPYINFVVLHYETLSVFYSDKHKQKKIPFFMLPSLPAPCLQEEGSMMPEILTAKQLAERWGISPQTLENWRSAKKGPDYVKMGGVIVYRIEDVGTYEEKQRNVFSMSL